MSQQRRLNSVLQQLTTGLSSSTTHSISATTENTANRFVKATRRLTSKVSAGKAVDEKSPRHANGTEMHGGDLAARALKEQNVPVVFTLTGGHISPILVGCETANIRVVDVRDEVTTVFAADAVSRMTGIPGVAIVTAGPGLTNTVTAVKNAQLAQSAVVVFAGATATLLKGRGSLQDIDQFACMKPHVKSMYSIRSLKQIVPTIRRAFYVAQEGVPGPVFVEFPLDVIWPKEVIMSQFIGAAPELKMDRVSVMKRLQYEYIRYHMGTVFKDAFVPASPLRTTSVSLLQPTVSDVSTAFQQLASCRRPVMVIGSQALRASSCKALVHAVESLGVPVYLSGMARGLLGKSHRLHMRHKRGNALGKADFVLLAGVPADFRLDYGRHINPRAFFATVNLCAVTLRKNNDLRKPMLQAHCDPATFMIQLGAMVHTHTARLDGSWGQWFTTLLESQKKREAEIDAMAAKTASDGKNNFINPLRLCREIDALLDDNSVIVADGGDFVGTASYVVRPRQPLSWLDPGVFGTLGVGGGFALGAKCIKADAEVWILFGDGALGWSMIEFDTYVRHGIPVIAVIGNDACWSQMHRDQVRLLKSNVATELEFTHYDKVAQGFGAEGILISEESEIRDGLLRAKELAHQGKPVLVNVLLGRSKFREGSISL
jgi:thiamine pyrophosphate-dependent acetolactate synthase large subunit-like protein